MALASLNGRTAADLAPAGSAASGGAGAGEPGNVAPGGSPPGGFASGISSMTFSRSPAGALASTRSTGWKVRGKSGLATVLMVARRTPLPADVSLARLIDTLPPPRLKNPHEWARLRNQEDGPEFRVLKRAFRRELEEDADEIEHPVVRVMGRLREHFEVIRAFRFAHQE